MLNVEFEEINERDYYEAKAKKSTIKKNELIEIHTDTDSDSDNGTTYSHTETEC